MRPDKNAGHGLSVSFSAMQNVYLPAWPSALRTMLRSRVCRGSSIAIIEHLDGIGDAPTASDSASPTRIDWAAPVRSPLRERSIAWSDRRRAMCSISLWS